MSGSRQEDSWSSRGSIRPPADRPTDLVDYLIELGIFRQRYNGKIDVPDLYLFGLRLRRKGGVRVGGPPRPT